MTRPAPGAGTTARVVEGDPVRLPCPGGPLLLRGAAVVETPDGVRHATTRPVSALCRCGRSAIAPWCDATHTLLPAADRAALDTAAETAEEPRGQAGASSRTRPRSP